jgi:hypothetical protein
MSYLIISANNRFVFALHEQYRIRKIVMRLFTRVVSACFHVYSLWPTMYYSRNHSNICLHAIAIFEVMFSMRPRTAVRGWSSSLGVEQRPNNLHRKNKKRMLLEMTQSARYWTGSRQSPGLLHTSMVMDRRVPLKGRQLLDQLNNCEILNKVG